MKLKEFINANGPLLAGEKVLVAGLGTGKVTPIGGTNRPGANAGEARQIRADFLRAIILGKIDNAQPHEKGVRIGGARITGRLDLEGCELQQNLSMYFCRFDTAPVLRSARVQNLFLKGNYLPGMVADWLDARGNVFLRNVVATGEVWFTGAKLGELDCNEARFTAGENGEALHADGLEVRGGVVLRKLKAKGEVRLLGAALGGDLNASGARFEAGKNGKALSADGLDAKGNVFLDEVEATGEVRLPGAKVEGDFSCTGAWLDEGEGGDALQLQGARVMGTFFLREGTEIEGALDLTSAEIGHICDEEASWPAPGNLLLDRCRYGAFLGKDIDGGARLKWLALQDPTQFGDDFWPQPWEQCAKVLREMGHRSEARAVLIDKEKRQRAVARDRVDKYDALRPFKEGLVAAAFAFLVIGVLAGWEQGFAVAAMVAALFGVNAHRHAADWIMWGTIAYGHRPLQAGIYLFLFWFLGVGVFTGAELHDAIKPNTSRMFRATEWYQCHPDYTPKPDEKVRDKGASQLDCFLTQDEAKSFPSFNALVYSADTLLPIVDLEMQGYWIPDDRAASPWGPWARRFLWLQIAAGWALSLLAVAGFSGLIRTDSK